MPADRWERWTSNFGDRHGGSVLEVRGGALAGRGEDGSTFEARLPFAASYAVNRSAPQTMMTCLPSRSMTIGVA